MQKLAQQLNLEYPGLEKVKAAVEKGQWRTGAGELLSYYLDKRQSRCLAFWDMSGPEAYGTMPWGAASTGDQMWKNTAEQVLEGKLYAFGQVFDFSKDENIDWDSDAMHPGEPAYPKAAARLILNRMYWLRVLDQAYLQGKVQDRQRAARQFRRLMSSHRFEYIDEPGNGWACTTGIRLGNTMGQSGLCRSWYVFLDSPEIEDEFKLMLLAAIARQADAVFEHASSNPPWWGVAETEGQGYFGMLFPEFVQAGKWRSRCFEFLDRFLATELEPDGTVRRLHFCPHYHGGAIANILSFCADATRLGHTGFLSSRSREALTTAVDWLAAVQKPDNTVPQINSSDIQGYAHWLKAGARALERPDWLYIATAGAEGKPPSATSKVLPYAGAFILRDGYTRDSLMAVMHHGDPEPGQQEDCMDRTSLAVDLYGLGRTLVTACGRYGYYTKEWRDYFLTFGFNTPTVDDTVQACWNGLTPLINGAGLNGPAWRLGDKVDFVWGVHPTGFEAAPDVRHARGLLFVKEQYWLVVDRFTGPGEHKIGLRWLLTPGTTVIEPDGLTVHTENQDANVRILPVLPGHAKLTVWNGSREPMRGWLAPEHGLMIPAPQLEYTWRSKLPMVVATCFVPYRGVMPEFRVERVPDANENLKIVVCGPQGRKDRLILDFRGSGSASFEGEVGGVKSRLYLISKNGPDVTVGGNFIQ